MSDSRDDEVHAFDQTNGMVDGLEGRTVNAVDLPDENAASASTLAGSGVEDDGVQADVATEDAPDLDARAEQRDDDPSGSTAAPADAAPADAAPADAAPADATTTPADTAAGSGVTDTTPLDTDADASVMVAESVQVTAVEVSDAGADDSSDVGADEDSDAPPTAGVPEDGKRSDDAVDDVIDAFDPQGDATDDDGVETPSQEAKTIASEQDRDGHRHRGDRPTDPLAGDPGHAFDQTNGVIDGFEGESDGTAASDTASAGERA